MKTLCGLLIPVLVFLTALPLPLLAAIELSAVSVEGTTIDNVTSSTTSVTIDATTTLLLACSGNGGTTASPAPSGATYNGVAMTASRSDTWTTADEGNSSFFYMVNPPAGTADGVVTWSAAGKTNSGGGVTWVQLKGVDTAAPIDASEGANFNSAVTSITDAVTVVTDQAWVISCAEGRHASGLTLDTSLGAVLITDRVADNEGLGMSYRANVGTGARTMTWTTGLERGAISIVAIKPESAVAGTGPTGCGAAMILLGKGAGC